MVSLGNEDELDWAWIILAASTGEFTICHRFRLWPSPAFLEVEPTPFQWFRPRRWQSRGPVSGSVAQSVQYPAYTPETACERSLAYHPLSCEQTGQGGGDYWEV